MNYELFYDSSMFEGNATIKKYSFADDDHYVVTDNVFKGLKIKLGWYISIFSIPGIIITDKRGRVLEKFGSLEEPIAEYSIGLCGRKIVLKYDTGYEVKNKILNINYDQDIRIKDSKIHYLLAGTRVYQLTSLKRSGRLISVAKLKDNNPINSRVVYDSNKKTLLVTGETFRFKHMTDGMGVCVEGDDTPRYARLMNIRDMSGTKILKLGKGKNEKIVRFVPDTKTWVYDESIDYLDWKCLDNKIEIDETLLDILETNITKDYRPEIGRCMYSDMLTEKVHDIYRLLGGYYYIKNGGTTIFSLDNKFTKKYISNINMQGKINNDVYSGIAINDTLISLFYDESKKDYIMYTRANVSKQTRHIQYSTSKDLVNWEEAKLIRITPEFDFKHSNYYIPSIYKYPDSELYISLYSYHYRNDKHITESILMFSRDRVNWVHSHPVRRYLHSDKNNKTKNGIFVDDTMKFVYEEYPQTISELILSEDDMFFFTVVKSKLGATSYKTQRILLRKNGFTSLYTDRSAFVLTQPLEVIDNKILINYRCKRKGFIRIELLGEDLLPITGYEDDKFDILTQDEIDTPLSWNGNKDINAKIVRLRITMEKAEIFSITGRFKPEVQTKKYTKIRFYYTEHTNAIGGELRDGVDNNDWREVMTQHGSILALKIIGMPEYNDNGTSASINIIYTDGITRKILLVDNTNRHEHLMYENRVIKCFDKGTSCAILDPHLIE